MICVTTWTLHKPLLVLLTAFLASRIEVHPLRTFTLYFGAMLAGGGGGGGGEGDRSIRDLNFGHHTGMSAYFQMSIFRQLYVLVCVLRGVMCNIPLCIPLTEYIRLALLILTLGTTAIWTQNCACWTFRNMCLQRTFSMFQMAFEVPGMARGQKENLVSWWYSQCAACPHLPYMCHKVQGISHLTPPPPPSIVHYFGPEMGGGRLPRSSWNFLVVNTRGVFSAHVAHDLDAKTVELSTKRMVQGRWGFILV